MALSKKLKLARMDKVIFITKLSMCIDVYDLCISKSKKTTCICVHAICVFDLCVKSKALRLTFSLVDHLFYCFLEAWPKDIVPLVTYLLHHAANYVHEHGPVWVWWCFAFEKMLTLVWRRNHGTSSVAAQV